MSSTTIARHDTIAPEESRLMNFLFNKQLRFADLKSFLHSKIIYIKVSNSLPSIERPYTYCGVAETHKVLLSLTLDPACIVQRIVFNTRWYVETHHVIAVSSLGNLRTFRPIQGTLRKKFPVIMEDPSRHHEKDRLVLRNTHDRMEIALGGELRQEILSIREECPDATK